jgi:hypothetical protein
MIYLPLMIKTETVICEGMGRHETNVQGMEEKA